MISNPKFEQLQTQLLSHYNVKGTSRYVALKKPAMQAHLIDIGSGEPIVILHGGDGEAVNWAPLLASLQSDLHLYAVDRPGFGLSDDFDYRHVDLRSHASDFVISLLDALELETATLVGGSMGGFFALASALTHPERVRKLVLMGMPAGLVRTLPLPLRIMCGVPGLARPLMNNFASLKGLKKQYRDMFHTDPATLPELFFETRLAGMTRPGALDTWAVLLRRIANLRGIRSEIYMGDQLTRLKPPTLLLWGEHDMASAAVGEAAAKSIPKGKFIYMKGIGHFPFLEIPDECARLILDFIHET